jgi:glutathione reductase (NADPH)
MKTCDLFVIGGGSGGVRAARLAAARGADVVLADPRPLGGTCVNAGCIPKKLFSYAAQHGEALRHARGYGWQVPAATAFSWAVLQEARRNEIARLNGIYRRVVEQSGVRIVVSHARLLDAKTVDAGGERWTPKNILIATGARAVLPSVPGIEHALVSDSVFELDAMPGALAVVGGGYIGCEFASIFADLGARVTHLVRGTRLLPGFDEETSGILAREMQNKGVRQEFGARIRALERGPGPIGVFLADGTRIDVDAVLYATGRVPNTAALGLEQAGIALGDRGQIQVDADHRTSLRHVFAVGDVTGTSQLTPLALAQAQDLVERLYGSPAARDGGRVKTSAVFTNPGLAMAGMTEEEARQGGGDIRVFTSDFKPLRSVPTGSGERAFVKVIVEAATDRVLGMHMVGHDAGEIIQGFAVALEAGITKRVLDRTLGIHPTMAEEFVTLRQAAR